MPTVEQLRRRLLDKLKELFQLNQPDLDFGFYRIMHAKAEQVERFLTTDLLQIVGEAFAQADPARLATLRGECEKAVQTAKDFGAPNPEETEPVRKAKAALAAAADGAAAEGEVYDHLYRFFERYYDDGDFISRRYFARETPGRAAPFAIPYNGEEVKLHWANADQYYIKTAEYFASFTFDLRQAREVREMAAEDVLGLGAHGTGPLKVHFCIVDAAEGEHGNVKESDANKRYFLVHRADPVGLTAENELEIRFEYRPDPEKTGQDGTWREKRNAETVAAVLAALGELAATRPEAMEYARLLALPAPTEKDKERPLLARYVNQYTGRNTMDYFIHKDLGGFLRRELDFYIKNEVMHLDDIESAEVPAVESYLAKLRVLRRIAGKLVDFLAQLEDFQKKLWLKKKFVVETNWCLTLDRVPESLYPEIACNEAQREEWVRLFAIDEIKGAEGDLFAANSPGYSVPLTVGFLKANDKLVLDTALFPSEFVERLLASVEDIDGQTDGVLVHSENLQALGLLGRRYQEQVKCIYIDPPYNTGGDGFIYRDGYQYSSWLTMLASGLLRASNVLRRDGALFSSIDDGSAVILRQLLTGVFGSEGRVADIVWQKRYAPDVRTIISDAHEYVYCYAKDRAAFGASRKLLPLADAQRQQFKNPDADPRGPWKASDFTAQGYRPNQMYDITLPSGRTVTPPSGRCWRVVEAVKDSLQAEGRMWYGGEGDGLPAVKRFLSEMEGMVPWTWWSHRDVGHSQDGMKQTMAVLGRDSGFLTAKPVGLVSQCVRIATEKESSVFDYFAGSGTTAQATIDLNREDGGNRKYILVEMGGHFDTVLKPRIQKVAYSASWKDGKPTARDTGVSHCFKYIRLESYEDTLNNLRFADDPRRDATLAANPGLREDYLLHYLLDVETRGSQSLLNIDAFADPEAYTLNVKRPGSDESVARPVDLVETFHYLIGMRVSHQGAPQRFVAEFRREPDPELPEDQHTRLVLDGKLRQDATGPWWFRRIEGWVPANPQEPNNGQREKVLVVWRKLTGNLEQDNAVLDEWFRKNCISTQDFEFDTIYVNGSNNLPNLRRAGDTWKVRLLEEEFMKRMWSGEEA